MHPLRVDNNDGNNDGTIFIAAKAIAAIFATFGNPAVNCSLNSEPGLRGRIEPVRGCDTDGSSIS